MPTARPSSVSLHLADELQRRRRRHVERRGRAPRRRRQRVEAQAVGDAPGEVRVDIDAGGRPSPRAHARVSTFDSSNTSADAMCACSVARLGAEEQPRLAVVVGEGLGAERPRSPLLDRRGGCGSRRRASRAAESRRPASFRLVVGAALGDAASACGRRAAGSRTGTWRVDRQLVEVGRAEPRQLGVLVGEQPALQQRVLREVDARHDVVGQNATCSVSAKKLSGCGPAPCGRSPAIGTSSSGISLVASRMSKGSASASSWVSSCTPNSHSGKAPGVDRLEQVAAMVVRVGAGDLHRLVPEGRLRPELGPPVELDEGRVAVRVEQAEAC